MCKFRRQELASTAWAFSTLDFCDRPLMNSISSQARRSLTQGADDVQGIGNIAWAYASLNLRDMPLFDALAAAALARISEFGV